MPVRAQVVDADANATTWPTSSSTRQRAAPMLFTATANLDAPGASDAMQLYSTLLVWPFKLNGDWRLVTYSIVPFAKLPRRWDSRPPAA